MTDLAQLLERVSNGENGVAARALVAEGAAAVDPVVDALRSAKGPSARRLREVLVSIRDPDAVPRLVDRMDDKTVDVALGVFAALGASRDARATGPLLVYAAGGSTGELRQALAVEALGALGDRSATDALAEVAKNAEQDGLPLLLAAAVTSLARLGNHEQAPALLRAWREETDPIELTRYVSALTHVVAPGVLEALVESVKRSDDPETQREAFRGLQYLGSADAATALAEAAADPNTSDPSEALFRLRAITGTDEPADDLEPGVVHRLGHPLEVSDLIPLLDEASQPRVILDELEVITGERFGDPPIVPEGAESPRERAESWWRDNGDRFEAGRLYKFGYPQELPL